MLKKLGILHTASCLANIVELEYEGEYKLRERLETGYCWPSVVDFYTPVTGYASFPSAVEHVDSVETKARSSDKKVHNHNQ